MRLAILIPLLVLGCSKSDSNSADTGEDTDTDTEDTQDTDTSGTDTGVDTAPPDNKAPKILSCDAYCEWHDIGDTYWKWTLGCNVTDPDGLKNIWNGNTSVKKNGNFVVEYLVACNTGGLCTTGFREDTDNILCSQASTYTFVTRISDWDGNTSKPNTVTGRQK
jgi:hypothetical protein